LFERKVKVKNIKIQRGLSSKRLVLIFVFILLSVSCQQGEEPSSALVPVEIPQGQTVRHTPFEAALARFEQSLAEDVAADGVGSIAAGVVVGNDVVWAKGFGWADVGNQIPADEDTIYRIGSISKSFTAVLMMQMMEKGLFMLDDPVEKYFPEIVELQDKPEGTPPITFRQLA
jgi:CubicO group peptidase (beta-lactamase class C family)